jgi:hypothetical protein
MRRLVLAVTVALGACGGGEPAAVGLRLSGLTAAEVGSIQVLVLGGDEATCSRALAPMHPLDDPELELVGHALFVFDGTAKRLGAPADRALAFYAESFMAADGKRPRNGRGCAETTLGAGRSTGVTITITAATP